MANIGVTIIDACWHCFFTYNCIRFSISEETRWSFAMILYLLLLNNVKISTFCHFCHWKRELIVILMYNTGFDVMIFSALMNLKNTSCKTHHSHIANQNNIKFCFLMTKLTKCWNLHVDTFNNTKYKFILKLYLFLQVIIHHEKGELDR